MTLIMRRPSLVGFFLFNTFGQLVKAYRSQRKSCAKIEVRLHAVSDRCGLYCASTSVASLFLLKSGYRTDELERARLVAWK